MGKILKPILYWSLVDVAIAIILVIIALVSKNNLGIWGAAILGFSALTKLLFAALSNK